MQRRREAILEDGTRHDYDALVVCTGAASGAAYPGVFTFGPGFPALDADDLIDAGLDSVGHLLTLVVPPGTSWPLPLYELALKLRHRARERDLEHLRIKLLTPEDAPLAIFGRAASDALTQLLDRAEVDVETSMHVVDDEGIASSTTLGTPLPRACPVVSLPKLKGRPLPGLPRDPSGFLPIDDTCRVLGRDDVFAAGDGTTFPIKQGGLATQQADVAAEQIAASLGADTEPSTFKPILRGVLLTGGEPLRLRNRIAGGGGEPSVARGVLWLPPEKISGRYLGEALAGATPGSTSTPICVHSRSRFHGRRGSVSPSPEPTDRAAE